MQMNEIFASCVLRVLRRRRNKITHAVGWDDRDGLNDSVGLIDGKSDG